MILSPERFLARIGEEVEHTGVRTPMSVTRDGRTRYYPLAVAEDEAALPAGSVVLTGTPEGVALQAPDTFAVVVRGILHLRSPFEQFRVEEIERARLQSSGGYLAAGDRMRATIDGLGSQIVRIDDSDTPALPDPCQTHPEEEPSA